MKILLALNLAFFERIWLPIKISFSMCSVPDSYYQSYTAGASVVSVTSVTCHIATLSSDGMPIYRQLSLRHFVRFSKTLVILNGSEWREALRESRVLLKK